MSMLPADIHRRLEAGRPSQKDLLGQPISAFAGLAPCRNPYCECDPGACTHPGCFDSRGVPIERVEWAQKLPAGSVLGIY